MDGTFGVMVLRIGLAALMGALTGFERKKADKPAGVRTMLLIAAGSAAFAVLGERLVFQSGVPDTVRVDTTRVLSYLIIGVGFLGGGAILHARGSVRGLTTAATIWVVAGLGAACGYGAYDIAAVVFVLMQATLWVPWLLVKAGLMSDPHTLQGLSSDPGDPE